jgi:hypothetical protein
MNYLTIEKTRIGYRIKDTITMGNIHYIGFSARQAEREHRAAFNLKYKHFIKIYI